MVEDLFDNEIGVAQFEARFGDVTSGNVDDGRQIAGARRQKTLPKPLQCQRLAISEENDLALAHGLIPGGNQIGTGSRRTK